MLKPDAHLVFRQEGFKMNTYALAFIIVAAVAAFGFYLGHKIPPKE